MAKKLSKSNLEYIKKYYKTKSNRQLAQELNIDKSLIVRAMRDMGLNRDAQIKQSISDQKNIQQAQNLPISDDEFKPIGPTIEISSLEIQKQHWVFLAIIFIATFFYYSTSFSNEFVWDDEILIENNYFVKDWKYIPDIMTTNSFRGGDRDSNFYRPMQIFSYLVDWKLWNGNEFGFHLSNTLFHAICSILIYILVFLLSNNTRLSFLTGFLFTIHPLHTEGITYMAGRADSLSFLFMLLTIVFYFRFITSTQKNDILLYLGVLLFYISALLSKEMGQLTPLLMMLLEFSFWYRVKKRKVIQIVLRYIPIAIIYFGGYLPYRHFLFEVWDKPVLLDNVMKSIPFLYRVLTFGRTFIFGYFTYSDQIYHLGYIPLLFFPFNLHMERGVPYSTSLTPKDWQEYFCIIGWIFILLALIYMFRQYRKNRLIFFAIFWFFLTLFPYMDFVPLNANMAEHWLYVPSMGFFILFAMFLEKISGLTSAHFTGDILKKTFVNIFILPLVIYYCFIGMVRNFDWKNDIVIWSETAALSNSSHIHGNLGVAYGRRHDYERAMKEFRHAIRLQYNYPEAHNNLGVLLNADGKTEEAEKEFRLALEFNPNYGNAHKHLADLLVKKGEIDDAKYHYNRCIEINPFHAEAKQKLMQLSS